MDELGYTDGQRSPATVETRTVLRRIQRTLYCFEYALASEPADEQTKWQRRHKGQTTPSSAPTAGKAHAHRRIHQTHSRTRPTRSVSTLSSATRTNGYFLESSSPAVHHLHHQTRQQTHRHAGGLGHHPQHRPLLRHRQHQRPARPLTAAQKAAYRTEWHIVCRPPANSAPGHHRSRRRRRSEPAIHLGHRPARNQHLLRSRIDRHQRRRNQTVVTEDSFTTPNIAPKVKPAPGGSSGKGAYSIGGVVTPYNTKITDCHFEYGPTTEYVYSAPCSPQPVGRNEVQKIRDRRPIAGDFRLRLPRPGTRAISRWAPIRQSWKKNSRRFPRSARRASPKSSEGTASSKSTTKSSSAAPFRNEPQSAESHQRRPTSVHRRPGIAGCCTGDSLGFAGSIVEGGNNDPVLVEAHLTGLTPGATYHYKLFATNNVGTVSSDDTSFVAPLAADEAACPNEAARIENNSTRLPECRAYELVTTAFKTGYGASLGTMSINEGTVSYTRWPEISTTPATAGFSPTLRRRTTRQRLGNDRKPQWPAGLVLRPAQRNSTERMRRPIQPGSHALDLVPGENEATGGPCTCDRTTEHSRRSANPPNSRASLGCSSSMTEPRRTSRTCIWIGRMTTARIRWAPGVGPGIYEFEGTGNTGFRVESISTTTETRSPNAQSGRSSTQDPRQSSISSPPTERSSGSR